MLARWPSAVLAIASDIEWFVLHPWVVVMVIGAPGGIVAGRRSRAAQLRKRQTRSGLLSAESAHATPADGTMDEERAAVKAVPVEPVGQGTRLDRLNVRTMSARGVRTYAVAMGPVAALQTLMMVALRPRPGRPWRVLLSTAGSLVTGVGLVYMMRGIGLMTDAWQGRSDEERRAMVQDWMRRMADKYGDGTACAVDPPPGDTLGDSPG